jgi:hypothetical protein
LALRWASHIEEVTGLQDGADLQDIRALPAFIPSIREIL